MTRRHVTALLTTCAALAFGAQAQAGGFSRGTADTDILFEEGNVNMRMGVAFVMPRRGFATVTAPKTTPPQTGYEAGKTYKSTDDDYSQNYTVPSMAVKFNVTEDLRCAGTYTQPFGADSVYGSQAVLFGMLADGTGTMSEEFITNEFAATCGYKFDLAKGRAWLIGGAFIQDFSYSQDIMFANSPLLPAPLRGTEAELSFDGDYEAGFRIGAAYEIPEYALRAQILYRSEVTHTPDGSFSTAIGDLPVKSLRTVPPISLAMLPPLATLATTCKRARSGPFACRFDCEQSGRISSGF